MRNFIANKRAAVLPVLAAALLTAAAALSCGGALDVVGKDSISSFEKILQTVTVSKDDMNGGWSVTAPDGSSRFIWSENFAESPLHDVMIVFRAKPFLDAGLDPDKLPEGYAVFDGMIMVGTKLGNETLKYAGEATPLASYEQIVKLKRSSIGYHGALDHYGVNLGGGGNMFEWAKDMGTNDKDIVFVLNPAPFIAAGVSPDKIEGWAFAKVTVDDENGKPVEVDKILKPFDLR
jgi:hypothetical protein